MLYFRDAQNGSSVGAARLALVFAALFLLSFLGHVSSAAAQTDYSKPRPQLPHAVDQNAPIVRSIKVQVRDIFDDPNIGWFYRTANNLKVSTREYVVRRELLFTEGDRWDPFLIEESERYLRSLPFLREVSIVGIQDGDYMDVVVSVQDTWTLYPQASLVSGGGSGTNSVGLVESNLLGYGKRLELFYADDEGRQKIEGLYDDRRFFNTFQRLFYGHFQRSDGYRSVAGFGRPFRSLVEKNAWSIDSDFSDTVGRLFENGDERFIYRNRHEEVNARYIIASGDPEVLLHRYSIGYGHSFDYFEQADAEDYEDADVDPDSVLHDRNLLPEDRKHTGPFLAYESIEPDFISLNYIDRFERVEDFNLGNHFSLKGLFAADFFGSDKDSLLLSSSNSVGHRFSDDAFIRGEIAAASHAYRDGVENSIIRSELRYYNSQGPKSLGDFYLGRYTLASSAMVDFGDRLDRDREFLLGASSGLRGYENRTFTGTKSVLFNIEERVHLAEDIFKLVSLGAVAFADAGGASRDAFGDIFKDEFYGDVGIGLRLGFPRSSGSGLIRIDLAFPWRNSPDREDQWEPRLYISTGQVFSSKLRTETQGTESITTDAGVDR